MQTHPVAIVLVNWNSWQHTVECIDSVLGQGHGNCHVFVVDNDSADQSVERIAQWCAKPRAEADWRRHEHVDRYTDRPKVAPIRCRVVARPNDVLPPAARGCRVTLIHSGGNLGFAGGCNVGLRAAGLDAFDFFWLLNTDTVVQRGALDALIRRASQDPVIGMVGSTLRFYDRPGIVQAMGGARMNVAKAVSRHIGEGFRVEDIPADTSVIERDMAYVFGASMLVTSRFIREVGLLQEDYFLYYEEADWARRGAERFKLAYAASSHIFHKSGASSSKVVPIVTARYYFRNRIRFMSRFFPQSLPAARRAMIREFLFFVLKGHWDYARVVASVWWHARPIAVAARSAVGATQPV